MSLKIKTSVFLAFALFDVDIISLYSDLTLVKNARFRFQDLYLNFYGGEFADLQKYTWCETKSSSK